MTDLMASPLKTGKQSVNLAQPRAPGSKIRRDPPPKVKEIVVRDPEERDQWAMIVGVLAFALAIFVITLAFVSYSGWSPRQYTVELRAERM